MKVIKRFQLLKFMLILILVLSSVSPSFATDPMDTWKLVYSGSSEKNIVINDIAYGNNIYVGVGSPGMLYYSLDGQKWNTREYSLAEEMNAVCYGNNKFVAVGSSQSAVSNDGIVWTFYDLSKESTYVMEDIAYGNGYFTAVGRERTYTHTYQRILTSVDGINWEVVKPFAVGNLTTYRQVIFANGEFIVVGDSPYVLHLSGNPNNTASWKKSIIDGPYSDSAAGYNNINNIAYGNGIYVALSYLKRVMISKDGFTWEEAVAEEELGIDYVNVPSLTFGNGIFVIKCDRRAYPFDQMILYSTDGKIWMEGAKSSWFDDPFRVYSIRSIQNKIYGVGNFASIFSTEPLVSPSKPIILSATAKGSGISVFWRKSLDATGYKVYRTSSINTLLGGYTQVANLTSDASSFADSNLQAGKTYFYKIQAYNNYGVSPYSDVVSATPLLEITPIIQPGVITIISPQPTAPGNLTASTLSQTEILLRWQDQSGIELGFTIERRPLRGFYVPIGIVGQNVTTYTDTALQVGTTYQYRVKAYTKDRESDYSNEAQATTQPRMYINPPQMIPLPKVVPLDDVVLKFYINQKNYIVNNENRAMDVEPIIMEGRTLLPIRYVVEPLGATVEWDAIDRKATVLLGEKKIELWLGQNLASVNGVLQPIDVDNAKVVPISVPPGRTMLPIRFIVESLGFKVDWDAKTSEVMITK